MITYEKLFLLMKSQGKNKAWLRKNGLTSKTVNYLINNKEVKTGTINKLCGLLNCNPGDILSYIPDSENNNL